MGSFYTGRAFVPVDQGGQPPDFPLGIMQFPAMDGAACNECKTVAVGASFAINAAQQAQGSGGRLSQRAGRRPRWASAGSRRSICRPPSRPAT